MIQSTCQPRTAGASGARHTGRARPRASALAGLLCVALAGACRSQRESSQYLHPNADLAAYQRVALLPLENLATDRFAADRVREILSVELASLGTFAVVENGEVNRVMRLANLGEVDVLGPEELRTIGRELDCQALMLGSVMEYRERRSGNLSIPEVSISLRLIDVESGIAVWAANRAETGLSIETKLLGVGERTLTEVVRDVVRNLLNEMYLSAGY